MNLLSWYLHRRIDTLGYGRCIVKYQFNHSENNGVAWYGNLDDESLYRILDRLGFVSSRRRMVGLVIGRFKIGVNKFWPSEHDGSNTMSVWLTLGAGKNKPTKAQSLFIHEVASAIRDDIVSLSKELKIEGRRLFSAIQHRDEVLRLYRYGSVLVEITKTQPSLLYGEDMDPANLFLLARKAIKGEAQIYSLKINLAHDELGYSDCSYISDLQDHPLSRTWHSLARAALGDLRESYRDKVNASA